LLAAAIGSPPDELALAGFPDAEDFAELAEGLSRRVAYLQLLGAGAVDRTRPGWKSEAAPDRRKPSAPEAPAGRR
jgi:hypothetical protein